MSRRVEMVRDEPPPNNSTVRVKVVRFGFCEKNHAAEIGGYVLDGCLEFMPNGPEGTIAALTCAACSCHRNDHSREEVEIEVESEIPSTSTNTNN